MRDDYPSFTDGVLFSGAFKKQLTISLLVFIPLYIIYFFVLGEYNVFEWQRWVRVVFLIVWAVFNFVRLVFSDSDT